MNHPDNFFCGRVRTLDYARFISTELSSRKLTNALRTLVKRVI